MEMKTGSVAALVTTTLLWGFLWALWPQTLGLPGLVGGVLFYVLLRITERGRRLADLSPARSGAWGAVSGLAVGAFVVWVAGPGLSDPWQLGATLVGIATLLGAISGSASPLVFRYVAQRRASSTS